MVTGGQLRGVEAIVDAGLGTTDDVEGLIVREPEFLDGVCVLVDGGLVEVWWTMPTGPTTAPGMSVAAARGSGSCHPRATSSFNIGINLVSCLLADLWLPQDSMACKSRSRSGSEMENSGWWDPTSIRLEKRHQSGRESNRAARSRDWRNSEPGVTTWKELSQMTAARSQLWAAVSRPLWSRAASSHTKRNNGGSVGSDGSARMVDRVSERRIGAREVSPMTGGRLICDVLLGLGDSELGLVPGLGESVGAILSGLGESGLGCRGLLPGLGGSG